MLTESLYAHTCLFFPNIHLVAALVNPTKKKKHKQNANRFLGQSNFFRFICF